MSARLQALATRKELLIAQMQLHRVELALHVAELREAVRPASLLGGAIAQPAALVALVNTMAPMFGLRRVARWVRIATFAFAVVRIVRNWRGTMQATQPSVSTSPYSSAAEE